MKTNTLVSWWKNYKSYVYSVVLAKNEHHLEGILYLRNELFCKMLTYIVPVSIIALIPGVYMSFKEGMPVVGIADLVAFSLVLLLIVNSRISIQTRKVVFLLVTYCLSVVLLYYLSKWGPGMLYLLFLTASPPLSILLLRPIGRHLSIR